jgi:hypothetical protein
MPDLTPSQVWILNDASEARGETIRLSFKSSDSDYEKLADMGLLKKVMVKSGHHPEFGYRITPEGFKAVYEANRNAKTQTG